MERRTRLPPYGEQAGDQFDEDASISRFMSYRSTPPVAKRRGFPGEEALPIFLSNPDELDRPHFERAWYRTAVSKRILKAGILAASAAAIVAAVLPMENPLDLFANARASLFGTSAGQSAAIQSSAIEMRADPEVAARPASSSRPARDTQPTFGARALSPTQKSAPTRDEIAAGFRALQQSPTEEIHRPLAAAPVAVAPAAAAPQVGWLDPDELAALLKRAKALIAAGDIAPARLLLERAADAQEVSAALLLAQTYDPAALGKQEMRSVTPDPAKAREWYQRAVRLGSSDAQHRLSQMRK